MRADHATLLAQTGRPREALPVAEDAYRIAAEHGLIALAEEIRPIVDSIRARLS